MPMELGWTLPLSWLTFEIAIRGLCCHQITIVFKALSHPVSQCMYPFSALIYTFLALLWYRVYGYFPPGLLVDTFS